MLSKACQPSDLKQLCALCGVDLAGNCTCKLRVSKLLDHFCYSDELKAEILERFKKGDDNQAEVDENLAPELDSRCEAELLTKLLEEKQTSQSDEKEEKKTVTKKQKTGHGEANGNQGQGEEGKESVAPLVPFPVMDEKPDLAEAHVPSGCSLNVYQGNASPYVIGRLPAGEKWKSKATHCKSFDPNVYNQLYWGIFFVSGWASAGEGLAFLRVQPGQLFWLGSGIGQMPVGCQSE